MFKNRLSLVSTCLLFSFQAVGQTNSYHKEMRDFQIRLSKINPGANLIPVIPSTNASDTEIEQKFISTRNLIMSVSLRSDPEDGTKKEILKREFKAANCNPDIVDEIWNEAQKKYLPEKDLASQINSGMMASPNDTANPVFATAFATSHSLSDRLNQKPGCEAAIARKQALLRGEITIQDFERELAKSIGEKSKKVWAQAATAIAVALITDAGLRALKYAEDKIREADAKKAAEAAKSAQTQNTPACPVAAPPANTVSPTEPGSVPSNPTGSITAPPTPEPSTVPENKNPETVTLLDPGTVLDAWKTMEDAIHEEALRCENGHSIDSPSPVQTPDIYKNEVVRKKCNLEKLSVELFKMTNVYSCRHFNKDCLVNSKNEQRFKDDRFAISELRKIHSIICNPDDIESYVKCEKWKSKELSKINRRTQNPYEHLPLGMQMESQIYRPTKDEIFEKKNVQLSPSKTF